MEFRADVRRHGEIVRERSQYTNTEEATKNALILPLLTILGYDVYDPREVIPEYDADVTGKKGEKVDYAICIGGKPAIFIECKAAGKTLDPHRGQLMRYFQTARDARFAVLTNGIEYRFYTDVDDQNLMDNHPFLELNVTKITDDQIEELRKFRREEFDGDGIRDRAELLRHTNMMGRAFLGELAEPTEKFIRLLAEAIYPEKRMPNSRIEYFRHILKEVVRTQIGIIVRDRIEKAITIDDRKPDDHGTTEVTAPEPPESTENTESEDQEKVIVTTQEEINSYYIVAAILTQDKRSLGRIHYRDSLSYFAILLDNNARKPICRVKLTPHSKRLILFDNPANFAPDCKSKEGETIKIKKIEDIYQYAGRIIDTFRMYEKTEDR